MNPRDHKQEIVDAYVAGETVRRIAARFHCSMFSVNYWVHKAGVPLRGMGNWPAKHYLPGMPVPCKDFNYTFDKPWDIDALIARIEAQIADDATRGGSSFSPRLEAAA